LFILQLARHIADTTGRRWICPVVRVESKAAHVQMNQEWTSLHVYQQSDFGLECSVTLGLLCIQFLS